MNCFERIFIILLLVQAGLSHGAQFEIDIPIAKEFETYQSIFERPGLLALTFEGTGLRLSNSGTVSADTPGEFAIYRNPPVPFESASVRFVKKDGEICFYKISAKVRLPGFNTQISSQVELNTRDLSKGLLHVKAPLPGVPFIPGFAKDKIKLFIQDKFSYLAQKRILDFLQATNANSSDGPFNILQASMRNQGQRLTQCPEPGDAALNGDRFYFFLTLAIWTVGILLVLFLLVRRGKRMARERKGRH